MKKRNQLFSGSLTGRNRPDIEKSLIEPRTAGGSVQNLSIQSEIGGMNVLANIFTCLLTICSKTVTVEGDVVR